MGQRSWSIAAGALALVLALAAMSDRPASGFDFETLQGGLNVETDQFELLSNKDLDYLHAAGVRSFRIFLWPKFPDRWNYLTPGKPMDPGNNPEIARVSKFVKRVTRKGFTIILVPFGGGAYQPDSTDFSTAMQAAWMEEFAAYAKRHWNPDKVLIETWNEPQLDNLETWRKVESALIVAIRRKAPDFNIVAPTLEWSSVDQLVKTKAYDDPKIIYDIHYYRPMDFTHQGMPWMGPHFTALCNMPYPGTEGFDRAKIKSQLEAAARWAEREHAKVIVGEFGAGDACKPPEAKAAYLEDVRKAAEALGMGWMVWDLGKAFGIASQDERGRWRIDPRYLAALGWAAR